MRYAPALPLGLAYGSLVSLLAVQGCSRGHAETTTATPARSIAARPAAEAPPEDALLLTGELAAVRSVVLTVPQTPSWIVQIRWLEAEGTVVKKGDRVAEFDNTLFSSTLEDKRGAEQEALAELARYQAESSAEGADKVFAVEERRIEVEKARVDAGVPQALRSRRDWEEKQLALQKARVELAKAQEDLTAHREVVRADTAILDVKLENARRDLRIAEGAVDALTLRATQDGTILIADYQRERRKLQVGDAVPVGSPVVRIPDLSEQRVEAVLYDVDDGRIAIGAPARCSVDAYPDRLVRGKVVEIAPIAQQPVSDSLRRTFRVVLALDRTDARWMRPGMSVKAEVDPVRRAGAASGPQHPQVWIAQPPAGSAVAARRETLVLGVDVRGVLQSRDSVVLGAVPLPGIWEYKIAMMAPEGKAVTKGEQILAFDTTELAQKLTDREAEADTARKQVEKRLIDVTLREKETEMRLGEAEAKRRKISQKLEVPAELASANELRSTRLERDQAAAEARFLRERLSSTRRARQAELELLRIKEARSRARVAELKESIARLTVTAPRDGFVVYATNWKDEKKKVGDTCWRGERVLEIPDLAQMYVRAEVDEVDGGRVAEGQTARFRLDAFPDLELKGRVGHVVRTVQRQTPKSPVKVVRLDLSLEPFEGQRLRPGMRGRGTVETERVVDAVTVPVECVFASPSGPVVWRRSAGALQETPVTLGQRTETSVHVRSGLSAGDRVIRPEGDG